MAWMMFLNMLSSQAIPYRVILHLVVYLGNFLDWTLQNREKYTFFQLHRYITLHILGNIYIQKYIHTTKRSVLGILLDTYERKTFSSRPIEQVPSQSQGLQLAEINIGDLRINQYSTLGALVLNMLWKGELKRNNNIKDTLMSIAPKRYKFLVLLEPIGGC